MTAGDLINGALKLIGVLAAGETADSNDAEDARLRLNDLLDLLATQRLTIYNQERSVYPLVSGTQDYTIGTGGTFNQVRPVWIDGIGLIRNGQEYPLQPLTQGQWERTAQKSLSSIPTSYYFNDAYPLGELSFYPVPNATASVAVYWPSSSLTSVASLATVISTPPGWALMLRTNLAKLLAPEFNRPLRDDIAELAKSSLADVKRTNIRPEALTFDTAITGSRGYMTGSRFDGGRF